MLNFNAKNAKRLSTLVFILLLSSALLNPKSARSEKEKTTDYVGYEESADVNGKDEHTYPNGNTYKEEREDKQPDEYGTLTYENGGNYIGGLIDSYFRHGNGKLTLPDGSTYEGGFRYGEFYGEGKLISSNGVIYEGYFKHNMPNGKGKLTLPNGTICEGYFEDGEFIGEKKI
ncbi:MAG: hypothetical protein LBI70_00425 [Rickettsiales bacterium]|jgi:hypothetical protein|nr:hypothetical protein [Rickettsiales bacterium]